VTKTPMTAMLGLRRGDIVQIRSAEEILATLDEDGKVDGMPFMPEMLEFAGRTVSVSGRADKTCDTTHRTGLRRLHDTVHLEDLRCDGRAHGGCQAGCLLYWKESWLKAPEQRGSDTPTTSVAAVPAAGRNSLTNDDLQALTRATAPDETNPGRARFRCQATEVFDATSPLPWWHPTQYVRDIRSGNVSPAQVAIGFVRWLSVRVQARLNGSGVPGMKGRLASSPKELLDLQPGDRVRVKSKREIARTLDTANRNRNLSFDVEMLPYCGQEFTVLRRVTDIIDERTGEMIHIPGDCIILDGVTCRSEYRLFCPRADYPYWREIWLSRVDPATLPSPSESLKP
jgi:hypothetical protein